VPLTPENKGFPDCAFIHQNQLKSDLQFLHLQADDNLIPLPQAKTTFVLLSVQK